MLNRFVIPKSDISFYSNYHKFLYNVIFSCKRHLPTTPSSLFDFDNNNEQKIVN